MRLLRRPELPFRPDDPSYMDDWTVADIIRTAREIERWYVNGGELYPRKVLEDVVKEQDRRFADGDEFNIEAIDGKTYQYYVRKSATKYAENGTETVYFRPFIDYVSLNQLLWDAYHATSPAEWRPFHTTCSVRLANYIEQEDEPGEEGSDSSQPSEPSEPPGSTVSPDSVEQPLHTGERILQDLDVDMSGASDWPIWDRIDAVLSSLHVAWKIKTIFAIGCGSLEGSEGDIVRYDRCVVQHVLPYYLTMCLEQKELGSPNVDISFQDSTYTKYDKWALDQLSADVIFDPAAYLDMDSQSLVFSSGATCCVKSIIVENAFPAILILDCIRNDDSASELADPYTPRVKWILEHFYQRLPLPPLHSHQWVPMDMYVRNEFIPRRRHLPNPPGSEQCNGD